MTLHIYDELDQGSEEWLALRRGMVTASVVGRLITSASKTAIDFACPDCLEPADSPCVALRSQTKKAIKTMHPGRVEAARTDDSPPTLQVADTDDSRWLTRLLVAERITGYTDPTFQSFDMYRGVVEEPRAREVYSEHRAPATECGFMVLREDGWALGYSPDGLVGDDGLIEVKSPRAKEHIRTVLADEVPPQYMPQLQAGLLVSGRAWIDYVSFCGGEPLWTKRVYPDPRWHEVIVAAVQKFEGTAVQMVSDYRDKTAGLPATERIDLDMEVTAS